MTIQTAIDMIDNLKTNMSPVHQKIAWLNDLDGLVMREVIMTHDGSDAYADFKGYDQDTDMGTVLLIPEPYADVYRHYLAAQIDIANRETGEYTKDMLLYNAAWQTFVDYWNRTHMPMQRVAQLRF